MLCAELRGYNEHSESRDVSIEKKESRRLRRDSDEENKAMAAEETKGTEPNPIKFKDVGRKFTFPFHMIQTWEVSSALFATGPARLASFALSDRLFCFYILFSFLLCNWELIIFGWER